MICQTSSGNYKGKPNDGSHFTVAAIIMFI